MLIFDLRYMEEVGANVVAYVVVRIEGCLIENLALWHRNGDVYFCGFYANTEFFELVCSGGIYNSIVGVLC